MNIPAISETPPAPPQRERPEDASGLRAVPTTVLAFVLIVAASFWVMGQPVQVRADILQLALTVWAIDKAWSLLKGLLGDLRGRDGMDMLVVAGHWLSTLLASALFALLVLGVVSVIWSYVAPPVLGFFGIKL